MDPLPKSKRGGIGRLSVKPATDDGLVSRTLQFVRIQLPSWRDDPRRPSTSNEKELNSSLCDFLDNRSRTLHPMVRFKHEAPQSGGRTTDIGVHGMELDTLIEAVSYSIYEPFFLLEAKRLPAPAKKREREYVSGANASGAKETGGIQRFKLGLHGGKIAIPAMIGYIQQESTPHWFQTINQWIADLVKEMSADGCKWSVSEVLKEFECDVGIGTATAVSIHERATGCLTADIRLYHIWVDMNPGDGE